MALVTPKVFLTGFTTAYEPGIRDYLAHTGQEEFLEQYREALAEGISSAEALCSMFAKLCYKALTLGKNANISKTRAIRDNLAGTFDGGHGSVFEHANMNFIITDCSRVFTHELVRHRAGTAFSQTSGRYCRPVRNENGTLGIDFVHDPILDPVLIEIEDALRSLAMRYDRMQQLMGLEAPTATVVERQEAVITDAINGLGNPALTGKHRKDLERRCELAIICREQMAKFDPQASFDWKKKVTSALRRILPNGQSNEIAFSVNMRTLRHVVQIRTQRFAEWEIRQVFYQIYMAIKTRFPMVFHGAKEHIVDGIPEVYDMKLQPYDIQMPDLPSIDLLEEIRRRDFQFPSETDKLRWSELISRQLNELQPAA